MCAHRKLLTSGAPDLCTDQRASKHARQPPCLQWLSACTRICTGLTQRRMQPWSVYAWGDAYQPMRCGAGHRRRLAVEAPVAWHCRGSAAVERRLALPARGQPLRGVLCRRARSARLQMCASTSVAGFLSLSEIRCGQTRLQLAIRLCSHTSVERAQSDFSASKTHASALRQAAYTMMISCIQVSSCQNQRQ